MEVTQFCNFDKRNAKKRLSKVKLRMEDEFHSRNEIENALAGNNNDALEEVPELENETGGTLIKNSNSDKDSEVLTPKKSKLSPAIQRFMSKFHIRSTKPTKETNGF